MVFDILLGREFFIKNQIKLTYQNETFYFEYPFHKREAEHIFSIKAINDRDKNDIIAENLDSSLDFSSKMKLLQTLREVDSMEIEPVKDNYKIRVYLKDVSFYRYAPRRMSIGKKVNCGKLQTTY